MSTTGVLAIDQGTTSSRGIVFDSDGRPVSVAQQEFEQHFPADGWVEHDPEEIWSTSRAVARQAILEAEAKGYRVVAIGITNQRETTVVWDRDTGKPIHNAIVWQDRRTAAACQALEAAGALPEVRSRTGLLLDPYFSASKVAWLLDNVTGARERAEQGRLAFGTIDSFLVWRLTGGRVHATDATNASRTNLFNIHDGAWDDELLRLFDVPASLLPEVRDCSSDYGVTADGVMDAPLPIFGVAGDQQAAAVGQCCFSTGHIKSTYGTGCFVLMNTGNQVLSSQSRLLSTIAYQLDGRITYGLEGSIFVAGAAVQWLRDGLGIIAHAADTESLAAGLPDNRGVYVVPAFTGLGAPHWRPDARGAIFGLTRATGPAELVRATLESVAYQTHDLLKAMAADGAMPAALRVDGGMVANNWLLQFLSDLLNLPIERPKTLETTALGAAYLAGRRAGMYGSLDEFSKTWRCERRFEPQGTDSARAVRLRGWRRAVGRVID